MDVKLLYKQATTRCKNGTAWEFEQHFAQVIAEHCANICEELGTPVAGCNGSLSAMADDCAKEIREEFKC